MWIDDQVLAESHLNIKTSIWVPEAPFVVLGRSNKVSREVNADACERDGIPIFKRLGGGGTVLLYPGCLVVSVGLWVRDYYQNDLYFKSLNQAVIDTLRHQLTAVEFQQRGFSDIVVGERKVAGTSLFRSRNYLLYQASLLIDLDVPAIEKYLAHPSAEPDYRRGRKHRDFLMGLSEVSTCSPTAWAEIFSRYLSVEIESALASELLSVQVQQVDHVKSRMGEVHPID